MNKKKNNKLSIIISIFNLEKGVAPLYRSLVEVMDGLNRSFEIVFVDDGSTDTTTEKLTGIAKKDRRVRCIRMRSSFGEASALDAGLRY
jgi:glycosyltransferase involved in cell wall biosynthesis